MLSDHDLNIVAMDIKRVADATPPEHGATVMLTLGEAEQMLAELRERRAADLSADDIEALQWLAVQAHAIQHARISAGSDTFPDPARALTLLARLTKGQV